MALDGTSDQSLSRRAMQAELLDAETELRLAYASLPHALALCAEKSGGCFQNCLVFRSGKGFCFAVVDDFDGVSL